MLETKLRTKGIDHTVLHVKDVAKSRKFYLDVLGMTVNHEDATHAFLWCGGGQMVALFQVGEGTDIKPGDDMNHMVLREVGRLFQDSRSEEISYFQRNGFYPIMHLVAIKQEVANQHPEVTAALFTAFEQAKETAFRFYDDPNWSSMAWAPQLAQEEQLIMGGDTWPNGLEKNRSNLERFIQYELDQGLIDGHLEVEDLFHSSSQHL